MSWFSKIEDYSLKNNDFYGKPSITYGSKKDDTGSGSSSTSGSTSGAWDDFQHERERICSSSKNKSR